MKKFLVIIAFFSTICYQSAFADCKKDLDMEPTGKVYRCENKEAVCYAMVEKHLVNSPMPISCFKK